MARRKKKRQDLVGWIRVRGKCVELIMPRYDAITGRSTGKKDPYPIEGPLLSIEEKKEKAADLRRDLNIKLWEGKYKSPARVLVKDIVAIRQQDEISEGREVSTRDTHRSMHEKHVLPQYGDTLVDRVTIDELQRDFNNLVKLGITPKTVHNIRQEYICLFDVAVEKGAILSNTARLTKSPWGRGKTKVQMVILTPQQIDDLLIYIQEKCSETKKDVAYWAVSYLAVWSGLRLGEHYPEAGTKS